MLAVEPAVLKPWLVKHLEPISDADPTVLADYVLALLKHDVTEADLDSLCNEQLSDFLEATGVAPPSSPASRKRPLETDPASSGPASKSSRPSTDAGSTGRRGATVAAHLPSQPPAQSGGPSWAFAGPMKGDGQLCRDYHVRGFCARGEACPYLHDAFATRPLPGFPPLLPQYPLFPPPQFPNKPLYNVESHPMPQNIPPQATNEQSVRGFFAKFGAVEALEVDTRARRAKVTFGTVAEAERALSSPEAVFGNRFVRLYRTQEPTSVSVYPRKVQGASARSFRLDNRSTNIVAVAVDPDVLPQLRTHLEGFGTLSSFDYDDERRECSVKYASRSQAEHAMSAGSAVSGIASLQLRWATSTLTSNPVKAAAPAFHNEQVSDSFADRGAEGNKRPTVDAEGFAGFQGDVGQGLSSQRRPEDDEDEKSWNR
ncbi:hypothetical protein JCM1840_000647 [Sporobolomyces johnsonii]